MKYPRLNKPLKKAPVRRLVKPAGSSAPVIPPFADRSAPSTSEHPNTTFPAMDPRDLIGWSAIVLRDEITGVRTFEFTMPGEDGSIVKCEMPMTLTEPQLVSQLRAYGDLPRPPETAALAVRRLTDQARKATFTKAATPGWKGISEEGVPSAFVLARRAIPADCKFRWPSKNLSDLGDARGTLAAWNAAVSPLAAKSNPIAFAICAALAAPLVRFADLTESAVFNFVGPSSSGKSSIVKLAQTVLAPSDSIQTWDFKDRALEEAAALHNDCPLIMDAAERIKQADLRHFITRAVHMLPDGKGMVRSEFVKDTLPNLTWANVVLSTSNYTGREMVGAAAWNDQESVRFIDLPIQGGESGGIFDRMPPGADVNARSAKLVSRCERAMKNTYGSLWPEYIAHLMTIDIGAVVATYTAEYVTKSKSGSAVERRIAQKFGLCFAAGMIAQSAGLLTWDPNRIRNAVSIMHRSSARLRSEPSAALAKAVERIRDAVQTSMVRDLATSEAVRIASGKDWWGVKTMYKDRTTVGIRREDLLSRFEPSMVNALISCFKKNDVIIGDGRKGTQLRMDLTIGSNSWKKPRFILLDYEKLLETGAS